MTSLAKTTTMGCVKGLTTATWTTSVACDAWMQHCAAVGFACKFCLPGLLDNDIRDILVAANRGINAVCFVIFRAFVVCVFTWLPTVYVCLRSTLWDSHTLPPCCCNLRRCILATRKIHANAGITPALSSSIQALDLCGWLEIQRVKPGNAL